MLQRKLCQLLLKILNVTLSSLTKCSLRLSILLSPSLSLVNTKVTELCSVLTVFVLDIASLASCLELPVCSLALALSYVDAEVM